MNTRFRIQTVLATCAAVFLTAVSSFAGIAVVNFTWSQSDPDPSTGSGMLTTTVSGIDFSAPMPIPSFSQRDVLLPGETFLMTGPDPDGNPGVVGTVGFSNKLYNDEIGSDNGFYIGWGGVTVNLQGSRDGIDFTFPVELTFEEGDTQFWEATEFDNPLFDVVNIGSTRWAGWIGDDGVDGGGVVGGHRHTGDGHTYIVGQDSYITNNSPDLDSNGWGDDVGINLGLRDNDDVEGNSVFLGNLSFGGSLQQDEAGITPPLIVPGDVNGDLVVDMNDFEPIRLNFGQAVAARTDGDLNEDFFVDFDDFGEFKVAFLDGGGSAADIQWVPEPSTGVLLLLVGLGLLVTRSRAIMNKRLHMKTVLVLSVALFLTAGSSFAAVVNFDWFQDGPDPSTDGSGWVFTTVDGIQCSAPMPTPTLNQKDTLFDGETFLPTGPDGEGVVGFANTEDGSGPGSTSGFHIGWGGVTVNLLGSRDGIDYTYPVELLYHVDGDGNRRNFTAQWFDSPADPLFDVQNGENRFAVWIGDDGDGHRRSLNSGQIYVAGQDTFTGNSSGSAGEEANGDQVGFTVGLRNIAGVATGSIFVGDVSFAGSFGQDESSIFPVIQPPGPRDPVWPADPFDVMLDIGPAGQRVQAETIGLPDPGDLFTPADGTNGAGLLQAPVDTGTGTTFLVSISEKDLTSGSIDWRDRGDSINDAQDLVQLGEDFIKNNDGTIRLDFLDLPPGEYVATSYHIDPDNPQSEAIQVFVDNNTGDGLVLQPGAVGDASVNVAGGVDGLTTALVDGTEASFTFMADGINPVTIVFDGRDAVDTEVPFSGMSLVYTPGDMPGDVNLDGFVDMADLNIIRMNLYEIEVGGMPVELSDGDANRDGIVDHRDYRIWSQFSSVGSASLAIPEPASLGIALLVGAALLGIRRRI